MPKERNEQLPRPEASYAERKARVGTPGSPIAKDGARHVRDFPCPDDQPRYLTQDGHMWLPLFPDLDLQKVGAILSAAYPSVKRKE